MLFNSFPFLLGFAPIVIGVYFLLGKLDEKLWPKCWLIFSSLIFYAWWNPPYLLLLVTSISVNFLSGTLIHRGRKRRQIRRSRAAVFFGVTFNLGVLAVFKYYNFFIETIQPIIGSELILHTLILPLGISFFTFQQITYLVDLYQEKIQIHSILDFSLFVSFFPQLIAGPIVHHSEMMPQFRRRETFSFHANNLILGSSFFTLGLFKKTVLADHLALLANPVFSIDPSAVLTFMEAWIGVCAYAFQIYFDFSGYSDMAIGLGLIFGIRLPANFESPYRAASIIDFWRRWHMTLSRFLRDYVYIPLGGNRRGKARRYLNLMLTMLLGGLWHGAAWAFVVWGVLHGLYLCLNHAWLGIRNRYNIINTIPTFFTTWAGRLLTFAGVCIAWTFFRTEEFGRQ